MPKLVQPFRQLGDALISPLPPDVRADLGATFKYSLSFQRSSISRAMVLTAGSPATSDFVNLIKAMIMDVSVTFDAATLELPWMGHVKASGRH